MAAVLICVIWYYNHDESTRDVDFWFSMMGTVASLAGIAVTLIQVKSMQTITEATSTAVHENNEKFNTLMSVSKVVDAQRLGESLKNYIKNTNMEVVSLRMDEFMKILISVKTFLEGKDDFASQYEDMRKHIPNMANVSRNVTKNLIKKEELDIASILNDIDSVLRTLAEINAKSSKATSK